MPTIEIFNMIDCVGAPLQSVTDAVPIQQKARVMLRQFSIVRLATARKIVGLPCLIGLAMIGISILPVSGQTMQSDGSKRSAGTYALNADHSKVLFSIGHFFVSSTQGQFTTFDGVLHVEPQATNSGSAVVHVSPASIVTGNSARDEHLRSADFFDVAQFPLITFESTDLTQVSGTTGKLTGKLSLHGVTKAITLNVTLRTPDLGADKLRFSVAGTVKRSDYGMNNYAGVIGDIVTIAVEAEFDKER